MSEKLKEYQVEVFYKARGHFAYMMVKAATPEGALRIASSKVIWHEPTRFRIVRGVNSYDS